MLSLACTRQGQHEAEAKEQDWGSRLRPSSLSMSVLTLLSSTPACIMSTYADYRLNCCTSEPLSGRHVEARLVAVLVAQAAA